MSEETGFIKTNTDLEFDPFGGPEIERIVACTEPQLEILMSCLLGGNDANLAFNQLITAKLTGLANKGALEYALQKLITQHESLRSAFSLQNFQLCIFKNVNIHLDYQDISTEGNVKKKQFVAGYIKNESLYSFDLANGPLFKAGLIKSANDEHYLILTAHHIICDGWSFGVILRDLGMLYSGYVQDISIALEKPVLFSDYARQQSKLSLTKEYQEIEKFWLDQYIGDIPEFTLATDFMRPQLRTYKSHRLDYPLDDNLLAAIKDMGTKAGCGLAITLLAAFETLLYRLTGKDKIVVGLATAGQSATDNYHLVGHCVNLLPVRCSPSPVISFSEYLRKRKVAVFEAYENQQVTFGHLLKKLKVPRDPSRVPLIPVAFSIDMKMGDGADFYGLEYELENNARSCENFELFLNISGTKKGVRLEWAYNTQLFTADTIAGMMTGFEKLLTTIIANPDTLLGDIRLPKKNPVINYSAPVNGIDVKSGNIRASHDINDYGVKGPEISSFFNKQTDHPPVKLADNRNIVDLFEEQATLLPGKTALVFERQEVSYKELNEWGNQLAHYLKRKGVNVETLVPICLEQGIEMLVGILGILKAGGAYVPIDPGYPRERINFMLKDIGAETLICNRRSSGNLPVSNNINIIEIDGDWPLVSKEPLNNLKRVINPGNLAYVIYTSGSTGNPKGVLVTHNNVASLVKGVDYVSLSSTDILLSTGSPSFDATTFEYWGMLLNGGRLILCTEKKLLDHNLLRKEITHNGVNRMWFTAGWFNHLTEADITLFATLKTILVGGEKLSQHHIEKLRKAYPHIEIINGYGPTENTTFSLTYRITETEITKAIPIGRPINNRFALILDENQQQVEEGAIGEIFLSGAGLSRGYLNRPELTAEKFVANPFSSQQDTVMYKSGDMGRLLPDGNIEFLGRRDEQVKIRGYRIELGEIESVIQQSGLVAQAAVLAKDDRMGTKYLVSYIVLAKKFNKEVLAAYLRSKIPEYMVPAIWVELERLPLTSNGKIDKKALPLPQFFTDAKQVSTKTYSATEKLVRDIWIDLLGVEDIALTDNFFELGGHSLIAINVMARIEKQTGKKLAPSALLQYSTIGRLATVLDEPEILPKWKSLIPIKPSGNKEPLYIIHGYGLDVIVFNNIARHMDEDQPVYGLKAKGRDGDGDSLDVIEEMAAFYISEIIDQNPTGPYAFIGFSAGSVIAFEMARQLKAMNKQIKMVGVVDYDIREFNANTLLSEKIKKYTTEFLPRFFNVLKTVIRHPKNVYKYQLMCLDFRYQNIEAFLGFDKKTEFEKVIDKFGIALKKYEITPADICLDLFSAEIKVYYLKDKKYLGWQPYALQGIKVHTVPGDHYNMALPPNSEEFARVLQEALDKSSCLKVVSKSTKKKVRDIPRLRRARQKPIVKG